MKPREYVVPKSWKVSGETLVASEVVLCVELEAYESLAQAARDFMSALSEEEKIKATGRLTALIDEVE